MSIATWWRSLWAAANPEPVAEVPEQPAAIGFVGQEVAINPSDAVAQDRNLSRIRRLEEILITEARPEKRDSLLAELKRRRRFVPREE